MNERDQDEELITADEHGVAWTTSWADHQNSAVGKSLSRDEAIALKRVTPLPSPQKKFGLLLGLYNTLTQRRHKRKKTGVQRISYLYMAQAKVPGNAPRNRNHMILG